VSRHKARQEALAQVNLLELAPVRVATWEEVEGRTLVHRPRPRGGRGLLAWLNDWLGYHTGPRKIRLDPVGSFAWQRLDGKTTVGEVARALREEFGEAIEPAEERLGKLVQLLHGEYLVAYPGFDEVPAVPATSSQP